MGKQVKPIEAIDIKKVKNLTFEGGGVAGGAYPGALEVLEKEKIIAQVQRVGGTSAGAICAVALSVGCTADEIKDFLSTLDFNQFKDDSFGIIRDLERLDNEFGFYKGDVFLKWIGDIIESKVKEFGYDKDITFRQLHNIRKQQIEKNGNTKLKDLFLVGSNISLQIPEVYSYERKEFRDMPIREGARISMSIPLFFKAMTRPIPNVSPEADGPTQYILGDGGMFLNDPGPIFDKYRYLSDESKEIFLSKLTAEERANFTARPASETNSEYAFNEETISIRLDTKTEILQIGGIKPTDVTEINGLFSYIGGVVNCLQDAQLISHKNSDQPRRTIYIDRNGISATKFDITEEEKATLIENGRKGVRNFIKENQERSKAPSIAATSEFVIPSNNSGASSSAKPTVLPLPKSGAVSSEASSTASSTHPRNEHRDHRSKRRQYTPLFSDTSTQTDIFSPEERPQPGQEKCNIL